MTKRLTVVVVTDDDGLASRLASIADGGRVAFLGSTSYTERGVRKIAKKPPSVTLVDAAAGAPRYLPFARHLSPLCPNMPLILLSSSSDVSMLAQAASAGFTAVLPPLLPKDSLTDALIDCRNGIAPHGNAAFTRIRDTLQVIAAEWSATAEPITRHASRQLLECSRLGLTHEDIADFLAVPLSTVSEQLGHSTTVNSVHDFATSPRLLPQAMSDGAAMLRPAAGEARRLGAAMGIIAAGYLVWSFAAWLRSPLPPLGVSGQVTFQGAPLELGEIEFMPLPHGDGQRHTTSIISGSFALPALQGLHRDRTYQISVKGFRTTGRAYDAPPEMTATPEYEQVVPPSFNTATTLRLDTSNKGARTMMDITIP